ncbi:hypothetical protein [Flavobacterium oreochromis]|uniref:Uncharacterized protein n=1 Tax=Flavobacterium columnare TaxID=996 RepID=A0A246G9D7_9FLAO|nr:hypothetical protein [Flavobacterium oreochromis]OWP76161.1 hypothetical protein BWK62_10355 [Flavobacterium oreochromis]QYS86285.1 hypothetical protein JJC03_15365 [Flavobacterium oreochromis]
MKRIIILIGILIPIPFLLKEGNIFFFSNNEYFIKLTEEKIKVVNNFKKSLSLKIDIDKGGIIRPPRIN